MLKSAELWNGNFFQHRLGLDWGGRVMAGGEYLWFPWQLPSYWKEPRRLEDLCDSPMSGQETVKKQPPSEAMEGQSFPFFLPTCHDLGEGL